MRNLFNFGRSPSSPQPTWLRVMTMIALLVVVAMGTAQVCHSHQGLATQGSSESTPHPDGSVPDHCQLCVALHSALPASAQTAAEPVLQVQAFVSVATRAERRFAWRSELASRPPPMDATRS